MFLANCVGSFGMLSCMLIQQQMEPKMCTSCALLLLLCGTQQLVITYPFPETAGFGLASHLGVLSGIPCVGVGKKLYHIDGLEKSSQHKEKVPRCHMKSSTC